MFPAIVNLLERIFRYSSRVMPDAEGIQPMDLGGSDNSTGGMLADRLAPWLFGAYLLFGYLLIVFWAGRNDWFSYGDWHFLAGPVNQNLWIPIEQHWSTMPALLYQGYLRVFGLEYFPFLATVAALHIGVVVLLWRVMVRGRARSPR